MGYFERIFLPHPRKLNSYRTMNYAFVSYEAQAAAANKFFDFVGKKLFWILPDDKVCHSCGSPDHIVKNCSDLKDKNK